MSGNAATSEFEQDRIQSQPRGRCPFGVNACSENVHQLSTHSFERKRMKRHYIFLHRRRHSPSLAVRTEKHQNGSLFEKIRVDVSKPARKSISVI